MGSIETIEREDGTRFRAVPWNAVERRKGRTRTFSGPDAYDRALAYMRAEEGRLDGIYEDAGAPVTRNRKRVLFAEFALSWATGYGAEWATRKNYQSHARSLGKRWPDVYLDQLDTAMIREYLAELQDAGLSAATRQARITVLRGAFREAVREGLVERDPMTGVKWGKSRRRPVERSIDEETMLRVKDQCPEWLRAAVLLSYDSGLRVGEICGLQWWAVDLDAGFVTVKDVIRRDRGRKAYPKNGQILTIPLSTRTVEALREHAVNFPGAPTEEVFRRWQYAGNRALTDLPLVPVHPERIKANWRRALTRAGVPAPQPRWHDLRHGCGHALARSGAPAHVVQAVMRHGSIVSTQVYMPTVSAQEMRQAMDSARPAPALRVIDGGRKRVKKGGGARSA